MYRKGIKEENTAMMELVKNIVRLPLVHKRIQQYEQKKEEQFESYDEWITRKETLYSQSIETNIELPVQVVEYAECGAHPSFLNGSEKGITLFVRKKEWLTPKAKEVYLDGLSSDKDCVLCYGDEDEWNTTGKVRLLPWLKPEFSPDLLLEYFYFGNSFAVKNTVFKSVHWLESDNPEENIYDFALQIAFLDRAKMRERIKHLQFVTTTSFCTRYFGREKNFDGVKQKQLSSLRTEGLVSIVIPSKDHAETLEQCLHSIDRFSKKEELEIIVVDNGSSEENKKQYEALREKYHFCYLYQPAPFNFSAMCNQGAKTAKGEFILFLNDDIEVRQSRWLQGLKRIAARKHVGAVGAKLCYPDTKMIQHAGITNIMLGPVHKSQFLDDCPACYSRPEFMNRDVIAVTAACLMMRREVFEACQGFCEELAVAFNDVDLCFRLYELGYYNVVCNEIHLWHYESLSRGNDEEAEKQKRLLGEREQLYQRHPKLYGKDPFDHPYRNQWILDTNLSLGCEYPYQPGNIVATVTKREKPLKKEWENECLMISLEVADDLEHFLKGPNENKTEKTESKECYIQGYAFVLEADNSMYDFTVLLESEQGEIYELQSEKVYRPDLHCNLSEDYYADMNGFAFTFEKSELPAGRYRIGVLAKSAISRQRLVHFTGKQLDI